MICLAGNGWGAVAALKSLQKQFKSIEIYSTAPDILSLRNKGSTMLAGTLAFDSGSALHT